MCIQKIKDAIKYKKGCKENPYKGVTFDNFIMALRAKPDFRKTFPDAQTMETTFQGKVLRLFAYKVGKLGARVWISTVYSYDRKTENATWGLVTQALYTGPDGYEVYDPKDELGKAVLEAYREKYEKLIKISGQWDTMTAIKVFDMGNAKTAKEMADAAWTQIKELGENYLDMLKEIRSLYQL
jgi:hypothetical protein